MLAISVLFMFAAGPLAKAPPALRLLQGEWELVSEEVNGKQFVEGGISVMNGCSIKGSTVTVLYKPLTETVRADLTLELAPHRSPKQFVLAWRGAKYKGIYALDGDDLFVAINRVAGGDCPTAFNSLSGKRVECYVFRKKGR